MATSSAPMSNRYLYTAGYEGLGIDAFVERLTAAGVQTVVDVRELPLSRKKGFSKRAFHARLSEAGIAYFHAPALGCPKDIRDEYRRTDDWKRYTKRFLAHLKTQGSTVAELTKVARATTCCLVCFEADFTMCHRTYVARAARDSGGPAIKHLTAKKAVLDQPIRLVA